MSKKKTPVSPKAQEITISEIKHDDSDANHWYSQIATPTTIKVDELKMIYNNIKYKGYDREIVLKSLKDNFEDSPALVSEVILVCAVRGPQQASMVILSNGKSLLDMGIPASGVKGTKGISCSRIGAATADYAAYLMKQLDIPKRLSDHDLPSWLQFPQAGAIKLPTKFRVLHEDFSRKFSVIIGGTFNDQIYKIMVDNSYLSEKLRLFDRAVS